MIQRMMMICGTLLIVAQAAVAQSEDGKSTDAWLAEFSDGWDNSSWAKEFRTVSGGYMRPLKDADSRTRMRALQGIVRQGKQSVPTLVRTLADQDVPRRILAAQALGFLAPDVPVEPLLHAARNDSEPAVRLYAVDALGMKGNADIDFAALLDKEKNRDVRMHIKYARERNGRPIDSRIAESLLQWDPEIYDTAVVGQAAPDFELRTATGETVKLSQFKGQSAVVLVFVYGDT
jgi:HEAT repeats/AhpC/TSA family